MVKWWVVSPQYETRGGDWYEPPELGHDVRLVEADTRDQAKAAALRLMRQDAGSWVRSCCWDSDNPFKGLHVERAEDGEATDVGREVAA